MSGEVHNLPALTECGNASGPERMARERASTGLHGGGRVGPIDKSQPDKRLVANGSEGGSVGRGGQKSLHPLAPVRSERADAVGSDEFCVSRRSRSEQAVAAMRTVEGWKE